MTYYDQPFACYWGSKPKMIVWNTRLQYKDPSKDIIQWKLLWYSFGINQQLFDLGVEREDALSETHVNEAIASINGEFDLVMITERMFESLVLLADVLCVPLENVAILRNVNERPKDRIKHLSQKQKQTLQEFLSSDRKLYDHFLMRFENKIRSGVLVTYISLCFTFHMFFRQYGVERMSRDAEKLRRTCNDLSSRCSRHKLPEEPSLFIRLVFLV